MSVETLDPESPPDLSRGASALSHRTEARAVPETVICPPVPWQLINARELWRYRELAGFLVWRDVKVRYKQTALGAAWAVLQPLLMMAVFTVFFGRLAGVSSGEVPYPLFAYAGLLPWTFFATAISNAGNSVVGSERLVTKIYFPRLAIPFAAVGAAVVDFVVAFGLLLAMMLYYGISPGVEMLLVPVIFAPIALVAVGVGTLLAALNVSYRDFRYVIPFLVQLWMFATPSVYMQATAPAPTPTADTASAAPSERGGSGVRGADAGQARSVPPPAGRTQRSGSATLRTLLALNPMTGLIEAFRAATLGQQIPWSALGLSSACAGLAFLVGCLYFRKVEDTLADII